MSSIYSNQTATAPSFNEEEQQDQKTGNLLYQAATILAILLFLISV